MQTQRNNMDGRRGGGPRNDSYFHPSSGATRGGNDARSTGGFSRNTGGGGYHNNTGDNAGGGNGGGGSDERELATRTIAIFPKRFYLDVKENNRGRFIKMAEMGFGRKKSRLILALSAAAEFREKLNEVIAAASQLAPHPSTGSAATRSGAPADARLDDEHDADKFASSPSEPLQSRASGSKRKQEQTTSSEESGGGGGGRGDASGRGTNAGYAGYGSGNDEDDRLMSTAMVRDNRRYFFDLKENYRGRFLRISQSGTSGRTTIAVPAEGLIEFRTVIGELVDSFARPADLEPQAGGGGGGGNADVAGDVLSPSQASGGGGVSAPSVMLTEYRAEADLPEPVIVRHRDKSFYFDVRRNPRGVFLRLTEAKGAQRTQLVIPDQLWPRFNQIFSQLNMQLEQNSINVGSSHDQQHLQEDSTASSTVDASSGSGSMGNNNNSNTGRLSSTPPGAENSNLSSSTPSTNLGSGNLGARNITSEKTADS